jgi:hypothetical protein
MTKKTPTPSPKQKKAADQAILGMAWLDKGSPQNFFLFINSDRLD